MANLLTRVQNLVGTVSSVAELDDWLTYAARICVSLMRDDEAEQCASEVDVPDAGLTLAGARVTSAASAGRGARRFPPELAGSLADVNSMFAPTALDPAYVIVAGTLFVYPKGSTNKARRIASPSVLNTDSAVSGVLPKHEHGIVLYAASQEAWKKIFANLQTAISIGSVTAVTAPAAPLFAYTDAAASTVATVSVGTLPTAPTFTKPGSPTLAALPFDLDVGLMTIVPPSVPADASYTYADASGVAVTATAIAALPIPAPSYVKPTASLPAFSDTLDLTLITPPTAPTAPSFLYSAASSTSVTAATIGILSTAPSFVAPTRTFATTDVETYTATDEDLEKAQTEIARLNAEISDYRSQIEAALGTFNKDNVAYQADLQKKIEQARLDLQKAITDANNATEVAAKNALNTFQKDLALYEEQLKRYDGQLRAYQADVAKAVEQYVEKLKQWQIATGNALTQYQVDVQNELNRFNGDTVSYRAAVERAVAQAQLTLQEAITNAKNSTDVAAQNKAKALEAAVNLYSHKLKKFEEDLATYQAKVGTLVTQFQANLQKANLDRQTSLEKYRMDVEAEAQRFNVDASTYRAGVEKLLKQAEVDLAKALKDAELATEVAVTNKAKALERAASEYQANLSRYSSQLRAYEVDVNKTVQQYMADIQKAFQTTQVNLGLYARLAEAWREFLSLNFGVGNKPAEAE